VRRYEQRMTCFAFGALFYEYDTSQRKMNTGSIIILVVTSHLMVL